MRVFFCKYNDPPYVKVEKLEIMIKLATEKNVDTFLSELKESVASAVFRPASTHCLSADMHPKWTLTLCGRRYERSDSAPSRSRLQLSDASTFCWI